MFVKYISSKHMHPYNKYLMKFKAYRLLDSYSMQAHGYRFYDSRYLFIII